MSVGRRMFFITTLADTEGGEVDPSEQTNILKCNLVLHWSENMTSFLAVSDLSISSFEDQVRSFEDQVEERPLPPPPTTGKSQGGRTWQPFVGSKNGNENFRPARIYNFPVKSVVFVRNRKFAKLTQ